MILRTLASFCSSLLVIACALFTAGPVLAADPAAPGSAIDGVAEPPGVPVIDCQQPTQGFGKNLSTGSVGPVPTADPIWMLIAAPAGVPLGAVFSTNPHPSWQPNLPNSKWIQPRTNPLSPNYADPLPAGAYRYRARFYLKCHPYHYDSILLTGRFWADNAAKVYLNANQIAACPGPTCFSAGPGTAMTANNWWKFQQGLNTLDVEVTNNEGPSGLLVRALLEVKCSKCCAPIPKPPQP